MKLEKGRLFGVKVGFREFRVRGFLLCFGIHTIMRLITCKSLGLSAL